MRTAQQTKGVAQRRSTVVRPERPARLRRPRVDERAFSGFLTGPPVRSMRSSFSWQWGVTVMRMDVKNGGCGQQEVSHKMASEDST
jgi:hypothetical protein